MLSKRLFLYLFFSVLFIAFLAGAIYVYKKKFVKIPTLQPSTNNISSAETKKNYLNNSQVVFVDFENYNKKEELYDKESFSGKYSYKVFGKNSFSVVITKPVAEVGKENLVRVGISAYVYIFSENFDNLKADLVFSIVDTKGSNVAWKNVALSNVFMKPQKWIKISGAYDIDINTIPNDGMLKIYLWNDSKTKILVDDIMVVTGKDEPYRGDTTYCDITVDKGWARTFNYPPFPCSYLNAEEINNDHSEFLIKTKTGATGQLFPDTKIGTGNFYNAANQKDKIIAVEGNKLNAYSYCEQTKTFSNDLSLILPKKDDLWHTANFYPARFSGKLNDEILLADYVSKKMVLYSINNEISSSCKAQPAEMKLNTLWEGSYKDFEKNGAQPVYFATPYFSNSQSANLLSVYSDGNWQLFEFQNKEWKATVQSKKPVKEWVNADFDYNLVSGKFLTKSNGDLILSVSTSKKNKKSVYSLLAFNPVTKNFIEVNSSQKSKVWGIDTLKASDNLFPTKGITNTESVFRYDNSWRFDLKHIAFNDTTYQILSTLDFKGYTKDYNPKFYEVVRLIPGCFIEKNKTSFLTICYNCKNNDVTNSRSKQYVNLGFLPNALYVFNYKNNMK